MKKILNLDRQRTWKRKTRRAYIRSILSVCKKSYHKRSIGYRMYIRRTVRKLYRKYGQKFY